MHFVIQLTNFFKSLPFSTLIAIILVILALKVFGSTVKTVIKLVVGYFLLNFILTAFLGVQLPTFSVMFSWITSLFSK